MHGKKNTLIIIELLVLVFGSNALGRTFNLTRLLRKRFDTHLDSEKLREVPVIRDISYLPEEDYVDEYEQVDQELVDLARNNRNLMPEYRNLCEIVTRRVQTADSEYEYQPPQYYEIFCKNYSLLGQSKRGAPLSKQKCVHPGFHCVQRSRTLFMARRRWESECWEPFTKEIASGCDCMWPVSLLGDITPHY